MPGSPYFFVIFYYRQTNVTEFIHRTLSSDRVSGIFRPFENCHKSIAVKNPDLERQLQPGRERTEFDTQGRVLQADKGLFLVAAECRGVLAPLKFIRYDYMESKMLINFIEPDKQNPKSVLNQHKANHQTPKVILEIHPQAIMEAPPECGKSSGFGSRKNTPSKTPGKPCSILQSGSFKPAVSFGLFPLTDPT
jgi:hypothetical protein